MAKVMSVPRREPLMIQDTNCRSTGYDEFPSNIRLPFSDAIGSLQVLSPLYFLGLGYTLDRVLIVGFEVYAVEGFGGV